MTTVRQLRLRCYSLVGQAAAAVAVFAVPLVMWNSRGHWWDWLANAVILAAIGWTWCWVLGHSRRAPAPPDEVRPRFGAVKKSDGSEVPIVFHPHPTQPRTFIALTAADETLAVIEHGDVMEIDVLSPGQSAQLIVKG